MITRLRDVRLLCLDMDGVLTDGHLYFTGSGWSQRFNVRDGYGIKLLQEAGVHVAILSGGDVPSGRARAESLGITEAHFGIRDKVAAFNDLAARLSLEAADTAFMGDELVDIPLLRDVRLGVSVPEAVESVRSVAHYVTDRPGGDGAVREMCDLILTHRRS